MQPLNRYALKEWAVVCDALASGRQTVLVRKGGIVEKGGDGAFEVEHREFFLHPTYVHQNPQAVVPDRRETLDRLAREAPPATEIPLSLYAVVDRVEPITRLDVARALAPFHILTQEAVDQRFHYRNNPIVHAVLVRAYRLPRPHLVPHRPEYDGCVSWVDLGYELPVAGAEPVVPDARFAEIRNRFLELLRSASQV